MNLQLLVVKMVFTLPLQILALPFQGYLQAPMGLMAQALQVLV